VLGLSEEDRQIIQNVNDHFGVAGSVLIQYLVDNEEHLRALVQKCTARIRKEFNSTDDERFWTNTTGAALATGIILSGKHTDLVNLPMDAILNEIRAAIETTRAKIKAGERSASGVFDTYIQENYGKLLIVRYLEGRKLLAELGGAPAPAMDVSAARSSIAGRVEHDKVPGHDDIFIEKKMIQRYANEMGFGWDTFVMKLREDTKNNVLVEIKAGKTMSSDTNVATFRVEVLRVLRKKADAEEEPESALATG
jgi:hypothetical protein